MSKLIYSQGTAAWARILNMNADDSRIVDYVNRASQRLLESMKAVGTVVRYRVCTSESCLVLPRQIETVEAYALESCPGIVRNQWYEFIGGGPGIQSADGCNTGCCGAWTSCCGGNNLIMGDDVSSFDNVAGEEKKLAIYSDVDEDTTDGYVIVQFYDENGQWVRTEDSPGVWIDGEKLALPAAGNYTYTDNFCMAGGFVAAIKTTTNGTIRLYEYAPNDGGALRPLAYYEHDETVPRYRSILIPGLSGCASEGEDGCTKKTLIIRGKQRFVPIAGEDNDLLQIESVEAIRLGIQAILKEEKDLLADAFNYWSMAMRVLDNQLLHYQGAGAQQPVLIQQVGISGARIPTLI